MDNVRLCSKINYGLQFILVENKELKLYIKNYNKKFVFPYKNSSQYFQKNPYNKYD
jgi:hypothetical protein